MCDYLCVVFSVFSDALAGRTFFAVGSKIFEETLTINSITDFILKIIENHAYAKKIVIHIVVEFEPYQVKMAL